MEKNFSLNGKSREERFIQKKIALMQRLAQSDNAPLTPEEIAQRTAALEQSMVELRQRYALLMAEGQQLIEQAERVLAGLQKQSKKQAKQLRKQLAKYEDVLPGVTDLIDSLSNMVG